MRFAPWIASGCLLFVGCASEESTPGGVDPSALELLGVYEITSHTGNLSGCTEGNPVSGPGYLAVFSYKLPVLGDTWVKAYSCGSVSECQSLVETYPDVGDNAGFTFEHGDRAGVSATLYSDGYLLDGVCHNPQRLENRLTVVGEGAIRIESKFTYGGDYPPLGGECSREATKHAFEGTSCSTIEVITGTKVAEL